MGVNPANMHIIFGSLYSAALRSMRVRAPSLLRTARGFCKDKFTLPSDKQRSVHIWGQSVARDGCVLLADLYNQRVSSLELQTGALHVAFEERDAGWCVSNAREVDTREPAAAAAAADVLAVTECNSRERRVVLAKKSNARNIYTTDHTVTLDETSHVCFLVQA